MKASVHRMPYPASIRTGWLAVVAAILLGVAAAPRTATAEPKEPPLAMTLVDATPGESGSPYEKIRAIVANSEDIEFRDPAHFLERAASFQVDREDLASTRGRASRRERIRRAMRAEDLESIVVYKRDDDTLHLIVVGPTGAELRHFREEAPVGALADERAIAYLERMFRVLVPEIRAFRRQRERLGGDDAQTDQPAADPPSDPRDRAIEQHRREHANLGRHVTVSASPLVGRREVTIDTESNFRLGHSTPFLGVHGRIDSIFGLIAADTAALGASAYVDYAPFRTRFEQEQKSFAGSFFRTGATFRYMAGLSRRFVLFGEAGGEFLDVGIASNPVYVGSRYLAARAGLGFIYRLTDAIRTEIAANALPTIRTTTNDEAFGRGAFSVGALGDARLTIVGFDPVLVSAFYTFELYRPRHANPPEYDGAAAGNDVLHLGGISVGYKF